MTWNEYVAWLVSEHGSLAAAAQRAAGAERDAESVERALRRLRAKKNGDGGDWGRRLLRTFGLPRETADRVKWMGLYHSRFADLPLELCLDQLRAWNRPPVSESPARLWLSLGLATCALRRGELDDTERHLAEARRTTQAPDDARLELELVTAFVASKREQPVDLLRLEPLVRKVNDPDFTARWLDQRAYAGEPELYGQISETTPFSASKRHGGLAYVAWRAGHRPRARRHAEAAITAAGDGGFTRMRLTYLGLLAHITGDPTIRERAVRAARHLGDLELVSRLSRTAESAPAESPRPRPRGAAASRRTASRAPRTTTTRRRP